MIYPYSTGLARLMLYTPGDECLYANTTGAARHFEVLRADKPAEIKKTMSRKHRCVSFPISWAQPLLPL